METVTDEKIGQMSETTRLFRYFPAEAAIKTIEMHNLRVGRPREFNDPFEWKLGIDRFQELSLTENAEEICRNEDCLDFMCENYGVICFSSVCDDPILWSHYANSHYGIAIEVECVKGDALVEVTYETDELPRVPKHYRLNRSQYNDELKKIFTNLTKQKSPSWRYEKEWRAIVELNLCQVSEGMYFRKLSDDDITRVIIGCRSQVSPNYIRQALKVNGWKTDQVVNASLSFENYKIELSQE